jgi:hypothetical protein
MFYNIGPWSQVQEGEEWASIEQHTLVFDWQGQAIEIIDITTISMGQPGTEVRSTPQLIKISSLIPGLDGMKRWEDPF